LDPCIILPTERDGEPVKLLVAIRTGKLPKSLLKTIVDIAPGLVEHTVDSEFEMVTVTEPTVVNDSRAFFKSTADAENIIIPVVSPRNLRVKYPPVAIQVIV
jgi:hypothetical protein